MFDVGLKVYEMNLDRPTGDIVVEPAMSEEECAKAMAYGMMAVEPGIDALALGEMGIGKYDCAAALCAGLFGGAAELWTGPGTAVAGAALEAKRAVVAQAVARHRRAAGDPFDMLRRLGGLEFAAIAGAVTAARLGRVPVLLDGFASTAAAASFAADPRAPRPSRRGAPVGEPAAIRASSSKSASAALRLRHEARRSSAQPRLRRPKAAVACHTGTASFAEAGVSGRVRVRNPVDRIASGCLCDLRRITSQRQMECRQKPLAGDGFASERTASAGCSGAAVRCAGQKR